MRLHAGATVAATFGHDPSDNTVLVADGYGISIRVNRGHLVISDGIGQHRRERRLPRIQRRVRRILVLGHTGTVTLDAIRWCVDTGVTLLQLDTDGRVLAATSRGPDDARLRRAQALAADRPSGLHIAQSLLTVKLDGQAAVADQDLDADTVAGNIRQLRDSLAAADTVTDCVSTEATAANLYFGAWVGNVRCRFATRDIPKVPQHWGYFGGRGSPLDNLRSPRRAGDPVNALLNYGYALAEAECRTALYAMGLDPGLGIAHRDKKNRDSLALDLLEAIRPTVDHHVLQLLGKRVFRWVDFHETRQGGCRLLAPLTHELAQLLPVLAAEIAPHAETVAHLILDDAAGVPAARTPLTKANARAQQPTPRRARTAAPRERMTRQATCAGCGTPLAEPRRKFCPGCWTVTRREQAKARAANGAAALAAARAGGHNPTNTPEAAAKRSRSLSRQRRQQALWSEPQDDSWTLERFQAEIVPTLATVPLSALQQATGLSVSACSRIRSGGLTPHRRHWPPLVKLADER